MSSTEIGYVNGVTSAIQTQINTKAASDSPTFTGTVTLPSTTAIGTVTSTEIGYLDGVSSAIQTQLDAKATLAAPTFTGTVTLPGTTSIGDVSSTEIGYVNGVTSGIQTQLDAKSGTGHSHLLAAGATDVTASAAEVNLIDGSIAGTIANGKAVIYGAAGEVNATTLQIAGSSITSTAAELNILDGVTADSGELNILDGATLSTTELNYVDGVTSSIQTQLDAKAALSGATFTGAVSGTSLTLSGDLTVNGTTTNINSTNLVVEDKNVVLGDVTTPTDTTADGGGITLKGATDKTFNWVDATDSWTSSENINLASGKDLKVNGTAVISSTAGGFIFTDGTQTKEGVPSRTTISTITDTYNLSTGGVALRDTLVECNKATGFTITIPLNATTSFPVGTSIDFLQIGAGQVTFDKVVGVTLNATPGFKLRSQWSSATLFKRATDSWVLMGDLSA